MDQSDDSLEFTARRAEMVAKQIMGRGVTAPRVLAAMSKVPREIFVPERERGFAYEDSALSIAEGQTISQPFMVAYMLEALELQPGDRALEIGTGSGYGAAVLAELVSEVHTIERLPVLADAAAARLRVSGYTNAPVHTGDGTLGHPAAAPYDAIAVTAGGPVVPPSLIRQLAVGGRLVIPIGSPGDQVLMRVRRTSAERCEREQLAGCRFVRLIGVEAWPG